MKKQKLTSAYSILTLFFTLPLLSFSFYDLGTPPMLSISTTDIDCFGFNTGTATANATGGTPPYSYLWNNNETSQTITNLTAGSYSVTLSDANALSATASVSVNQPTELTSTRSTTDATCGLCNGSASLNPIGGTSPYTFLWDANTGNQTTPTAVNLCPGIYLVTVTDANSCSKIETVSILNPNNLSVSHTTVDVPCAYLCNGIATTIVTGGTAPYTFQWDANANNQTTAVASNLCMGDYTLTVTDSDGCTFLSLVTINGPEPITIVILSITDISANGLCDATATATASGGNPPYNFFWSTNTSSQSDSMVTDLCPGSYHLSVSDNNCLSTVSIVINNVTGTINLLPEQSVSLFPNPNKGHFIIYLEGAAMGQEWQIDLFDLQGRSVRTSEVNRIDRQLEIQTTDLADGIYLFRLQNASGVVVKKLLISRE